MGRKNKVETAGGTVEQLESKPTTKRERKKQQVFPEVQAALDAVKEAKQRARDVAKASRLTARIVHAITKSGADPLLALNRAANSFGLAGLKPAFEATIEPTEAQLAEAVAQDEAAQ